MILTGKQKMQYSHSPVMLRETLNLLDLIPGKIIVDATLGGGGHAEAILNKILPGGILIGIDCDQDALDAAGKKLAAYKGAFIPVKANFSSLGEIVHGLGLEGVDGLLFDLGVSSFQLDCRKRGFAYKEDVLLDMRMDQDLPQTAADLLNSKSWEQLAKLFWEYGEERWAKRIASFIVRHRSQEGPLTHSSQLVELIKAAVPVAKRRKGHPAKRVFQALRIAVNNELMSLKNGLSNGVGVLRHEGRIVVISYHSLEDVIVKQYFNECSRGCICPPKLPVCSCGRSPVLQVLTRRPLIPTEREKERNPRAKSARLRAAKKLPLPNSSKKNGR